MTEDKNSKCGICHKDFPEHKLTGTKVGIWFVVCCEPCRGENEREKAKQPECVIEIIDPERSVSEAMPETDHPQDRQGILF